jgi:hypothetical protein
LFDTGRFDQFAKVVTVHNQQLHAAPVSRIKAIMQTLERKGKTVSHGNSHSKYFLDGLSRRDVIGFSGLMAFIYGWS